MLSLLGPALPCLLPVKITQVDLTGWKDGGNGSNFSLGVVRHKNGGFQSGFQDDRIDRASVIWSAVSD